MASPSSSAPSTKPPKRTYGRAKPAIAASVSTSSHRISTSISSDISSTYTSSDAPAEVPASSEASNSSPLAAADAGRVSEAGASKDASNKHKWDWEAKLKQLDESGDEEEVISLPKGAVPLLEITGHGPGPLSPEQRNRKGLHTSVSPDRATEPSLSQDASFGSLSTQTASSVGASQKTLASSPSPTLKSHPLKRVSKQKRVVESDAESDLEGQNKSSNSSSPVKDAINTPKGRSSSTPPTSDEETSMPSAKRKPNSKAKSTTTRNPLVLEPAVDLDRSMASSKKRPQSNKVKPPTKKERRETEIERQRLLAENSASISRTTGSSRLTVPNLLSKVAKHGSSSRTRPLKGEYSLDPISDFSSPKAPVDRDSEGVDPDTSRDFDFPMELPPVAESDDEPLPDLDQILQEKKAKDLKAKKLLLLQRQQQQQDAFKADDDDDDDLEVVDGPNISMQVAVKEEAEARKSGRPSLTASERILQKHAGISTSRRPTEVRSTTQARNPGELSMVLMRNVREDNARRSKEKGEEWVRRGGKPLDSEIPVTETRGIEWYAQQALDNAGKTKAETEEGGEEEDEDDEEWTPALRGSASPEPQELGSGDEDNENEGEEDQDVTMVAEEDASTQDEAPSRRSNRNVIGSDTEDENDENVRPQLGRVLVPDSMILDLPAPQVPHRQSDSSCDGATEDEGDKENNDRLMYDRGEDKENTAVVRYGLSSQGNSGTRPSLGPRQTSLLNLEEGLASRLSMSPGPGGYSTDEDKENPRSPLKTLSVTDIAPAPVPFAVRLQRSAQAITADENSEPLSPTFAPPISRQRQISGFSQFSDDGEGAQPKKLEAGFSDFFDSDTQKPSSSRPAFGTFKEPSQTNKFLAKLRRNDSLSLTQDIGLQPALEVDESLKRQADQVFEKEQEFLLDGANKSTNNEPELYINDQGFLTQTRPAGNAEVYRPNPAQSQAFSQQHASATQLSMTQTRTPFRELSTADLMEDLSEPSTRPRRLMKRRSPSPLSSAFPSNLERKRASTPSPLTNDIFKRPERVDRPRADKPRRRLEKSEFIEGEAQESDEDEMFGFRKAREADEEDGEDQDQTLETLVDDKAMDQTEIAEERVVEKYQEHLQADDARNEELANMAVGGQLRYGKRARDQAGIDDSDDDSEEDEKNRRIRRKMKEPELRGDIKSLAEHDATRAFAEHYRAGIRDDIDELAFLRDDSQDVVMTSMSHQDEEHADAQSDEEDDENYVTPGEIARQVRELAQNPEAERQTIDPYDTNFVDAGIDEDDDLPKFRVAKPNRDPRSARRAPVDQFDEDASQSFRSESMIDERDRSRMKAFVKGENQKMASRTRSGIGISVTGNHKTNAKTGVASRSRNNPLNEKKPQPVKAAPSVLNLVDRKDRFQ